MNLTDTFVDWLSSRDPVEVRKMYASFRQESIRLGGTTVWVSPNQREELVAPELPTFLSEDEIIVLDDQTAALEKNLISLISEIGVRYTKNKGVLPAVIEVGGCSVPIPGLGSDELEMLELLLSSPIHGVIIRPDFGYDLDGQRGYVFEVNAGAQGGGMAYSRLRNKIAINDQLVQQFARDQRVELQYKNSLEAIMAQLARSVDLPLKELKKQHLCFVGEAVFLTQAEHIHAVQTLNKWGYNASYSRLTDLEVGNHGLHHAGRKIDIAFRQFRTCRLLDIIHGKQEVSDLRRKYCGIETPDYTAADQETARAFIEAARNGSLQIVNPLGSEVLGYKSFLASLQVMDIGLAGCIPSSFLYREGRLLPDNGNSAAILHSLATGDKRYMLKPAAGLGGAGVCLTKEQIKAGYQRLLAGDHYVVQEMLSVMKARTFGTFSGTGPLKPEERNQDLSWFGEAGYRRTSVIDTPSNVSQGASGDEQTRLGAVVTYRLK